MSVPGTNGPMVRPSPALLSGTCCGLHSQSSAASCAKTTIPLPVATCCAISLPPGSATCRLYPACSTLRVEQPLKVEQKSPITTRVVPTFHFKPCFSKYHLHNNQ